MMLLYPANKGPNGICLKRTDDLGGKQAYALVMKNCISGIGATVFNEFSLENSNLDY